MMQRRTQAHTLKTVLNEDACIQALTDGRHSALSSLYAGFVCTIDLHAACQTCSCGAQRSVVDGMQAIDGCYGSTVPPALHPASSCTPG